MFEARRGTPSKDICGTSREVRVVAASSAFAALGALNTDFASTKSAFSTMCPARPSRSWRSWPIGDSSMAGTTRKSGVRQVPLSEVKDDLSHFLREAEKQDIVITRHGKPAGVLIGFQSEDDWFEYRLENDPRFLRRIAKARKSLRAGRGVRLEEIE